MPEKLVDLFNNIKGGVFGTKTAEVDKEIDRAVSSIQKYTSSIDKNVYLDTLKGLISKTGGVDIDNMFNDLGGATTGIEQFNQGDRLARYKEYDAIVTNIAYCKRALKVMTDNILSPDDITKRNIQFINRKTESLEDNRSFDTIMSRLKEISIDIKMEDHVDRMVNNTLKKGDWFIEIIHSSRGEHALTILNESANKMCSIPYTISIENKQIRSVRARTGNIIISEFSSPSLSAAVGLGPTASSMSAVSYTVPTHHAYKDNLKSKDGRSASTDINSDDDVFDKDKFSGRYNRKPDENTNVLIKDLFITFHDPKYVIRLETQRFKTCLGYLVFPKIDLLNHIGFKSMAVNDVDKICMDIIKSMETKLKAGEDNISNNGDLRSVIMGYLKAIRDDEDLKIRYVSTEMMSHWRTDTDLYEPYGESIFDCVKFDCKLLMALKTANTIKRMTHATDKRVIAVEVGLPRNAKGIVESLKEGMKKRKISVDKFGSVDTIPSLISTFEDIYLPMRDGRRFVEFDQIQFGSNPAEDIQSMEFIRDNIVASLNVPAPFLGLESNLSNRSILTHENIIFARTIVTYQKIFSNLLKNLFEKIYNILYSDNSNDLEYIDITFPPPKTGPYEHQNEYLSHVTGIIQALSELGIPKSYLVKKYLPDIDWSEVEQEISSDKLRKTLGKQTDEEQAASGGFGGGY